MLLEYPIGTLIYANKMVRIVIGYGSISVFTDNGQSFYNPKKTNKPHPNPVWFYGWLVEGALSYRGAPGLSRGFENEEQAMEEGPRRRSDTFVFNYNTLRERFVLHEVMCS